MLSPNRIYFGIKFPSISKLNRLCRTTIFIRTLLGRVSFKFSFFLQLITFHVNSWSTEIRFLHSTSHLNINRIHPCTEQHQAQQPIRSFLRIFRQSNFLSSHFRLLGYFILWPYYFLRTYQYDWFNPAHALQQQQQQITRKI